MPLYKDITLFTPTISPAFDTVYDAGTVTRHSGIYRCTACGREAVAVEGHAVPGLNDHEHAAGQGPIRWRLIAFADGTPKIRPGRLRRRRQAPADPVSTR